MHVEESYCHCGNLLVNSVAIHARLVSAQKGKPLASHSSASSEKFVVAYAAFKED
jgi:hypothetical protein